MTITIYAPDSEARPDRASLSASPTTLAGLRIAVLDNGKPNAVTVMSRAAETLASRTGATVSLVIKKGPGGRSANAAIPCADDTFARVVAEADIVITGAADCGSCTAYSVFDAISFEKAGRPAVVVTTTKFQPIAATMAADFGMPDVRTLVLPHPFGGTDRDTLWGWADAAVEQLQGLFVDGREGGEQPEPAPHLSLVPSVDDDLTAAVRSALHAAQSLVEADGSTFELLEVSAEGVVRLRLDIEDASCADCVMPAELLEATVAKLLRATVPSVSTVDILDPRRG
jgi:Fe-S cluster biogenesis protein NfuA